MKGIFVTLFFAAGAFTLAAQTAGTDSVINHHVTIEREYRPEIPDAEKINMQPLLTEPTVTRITPLYTTDFSKPLDVGKNIHYLPAAGLTYQPPLNKEGFARVGVGTGFNSLADFAYPLLKKSDTQLDFLVNHYGLFNQKAHSTTQSALAFSKNLQKADLYAGIIGDHEFYRYYGNLHDINHTVVSRDELTALYPDLTSLPDRNTLWRMNAHAGLRSTGTSQSVNATRYAVQMDYGLFHSRAGVSEHEVTAKANFDAEVAGNRLGIDVLSQNIFYKSTLLSADFNNRFLVGLTPYYSFEQDAFDLRIGFSATFAFLPALKFAPAPDIRFDWRAVPQWFDLYAGLGGGYNPNTLTQLYRENCYIDPLTQVEGTYTPLDFYAGFKLRPFAGLLVDAFFNYQVIDDMHMFINQTLFSDTTGLAYYGNLFDTETDDANLLRLGGRISYSYHDLLSVRFGWAYNHWSLSNNLYAWHKPTWEIACDINARISTRLSAYVTADFSGGRRAYSTIKLPAQADINLGVSYAFLDWVSIFFKVNNLINSKYELLTGYQAQGFNVMAGASFNF